MPRKIVLIQGHPDKSDERFGRQLCSEYRRGALRAGHEVSVIDVGTLQFPFLRSKTEWEQGNPVADIKMAQDLIKKADHLVLFFPLWLGSMPALLKAFLEQTLRPGFALSKPGAKGLPRKLLAGKSARVVVTMGMPAAMYRYFFMAHSLRSLKRNILGFCGIGPIRESLIGLVESPKGVARAEWLEQMGNLGEAGK